MKKLSIFSHTSFICLHFITVPLQHILGSFSLTHISQCCGSFLPANVISMRMKLKLDMKIDDFQEKLPFFLYQKMLM